MPINMHKSEDVWLEDYRLSVALWNQWYQTAAPLVASELRKRSVLVAEELLEQTDNLKGLSAEVLRTHPHFLEAMRMTSGPPMARDRLAGLAGVTRTIVERLEDGTFRSTPKLEAAITALTEVLLGSLDPEFTPWLREGRDPTDLERAVFLGVLSERMTQARVDPILRNSQEERQLDLAASILISHGYREVRPRDGLRSMKPGTFCRRLTVVANSARIPVDLVVQPLTTNSGELPVLIEAKSAGDTTNTNKRKKEEADKFANLKAEFGDPTYLLLLGGYFPVTYLRYNRDRGIDWMWEHNLHPDMKSAGLI